jgi:nitroreductase
MQALLSWREVRRFGPGDIGPDLVQEALLAGGTAIRAGDEQPWILMDVARGHGREGLAAAADGAAAELVATAPVVVTGFAGPPASSTGARHRSEPGWDEVLLSAGAAMQNVMLAFHALGLASCWIPPTRFTSSEARSALGVAARRVLLGAIVAGRPLTG